MTPSDAWKTHYDAKGLASDLRAKCQVPADTVPIPFRDELVEHLRKEAEDPLSRNRNRNRNRIIAK